MQGSVKCFYMCKMYMNEGRRNKNKVVQHFNRSVIIQVAEHYSRHVSIVQSLNTFSQASTKLLQKMLKMEPKWHYGKYTLIGRVAKIESLWCCVIPNSCVKFERNRAKCKSTSLSGDKHTYIHTNEWNTRLSLQLLKRRKYTVYYFKPMDIIYRKRFLQRPPTS